VAQGFSQIPGIDFRQTFAPMAKSASIQILTAYAAMNDWELDYFNTKQAFLKLQEDIYMRQPPGFEPLDANFQKLVCQLLSSLYRLKQAAYDWYELLHDVLTWLGFLYCKADYAIFVFDYVNGKGMRVICVIV